MLEYDRIYISEGIDIKKTNASKEFKIVNYRYLKGIGFKYDPHLCNGCHGLMKKLLVLIILLLYVKGIAYRIQFWYMSKDDVINIMNGSNLVDKRGVL